MKYLPVLASVFVLFQSVYSWHDKTHMAVLLASGCTNYPAYIAVIPDAVKSKVKSESQNHYFNNISNEIVTAKMVLGQLSRYDQDDGTNAEGHLYGAILSSISNAIAVKKSGKYYAYEIGYPAHYIGDLSMPLHNTVYDDFNKTNHTKMDGTVEDVIETNLEQIKSRMHPVSLESMEDIAGEVSRLANISHDLGIKLKRENRQLKPEEAYSQLAESASLLKAVLQYIDRNSQGK